jgi:aryl-alcohol dehydrogenase-like predicted oxidoreductase
MSEEERGSMKNPTWEKRRLGRTEMLVTPLGIGGAYLGQVDGQSDERVAIETVLRGLELGINLIDSSGAYIGGESERFIGLALQEWYRRGGKRADLVLSTKTGTRDRANRDYSYDGTMRSVETSLALLQTDYIDILHVHDPIDLKPVLAPGGALDALKDLKAQGMIRAIGLGCRPHEFHRRCIETGEFDVSLTFRDFNLLYQTAAQDVLEPAAAHDVGVFNATVTINGMLSGRDPMEVAAKWNWPRREQIMEEAQRARVLLEWAESREIALLALNLQFSLRERRISSTLIGFSRPSRVEEDVAACFEPIPDEVWRELRDEFSLQG